MIQKFFPLDKNYILKTVQAEARTDLLQWLIEEVKNVYLICFNPLGIEDDVILRIKRSTSCQLELLDNFYQELAGIYRFKYSCNQLEIIFDGRSHYEKYEDDWKFAFHNWVREFCQSPNFIKAVLECTILYPDDKKAALAQQRMKYFLTRHFELKVFKYKGIQLSQMA